MNAWLITLAILLGGAAHGVYGYLRNRHSEPFEAKKFLASLARGGAIGGLSLIYHLFTDFNMPTAFEAAWAFGWAAAGELSLHKVYRDLQQELGAKTLSEVLRRLRDIWTVFQGS